MAQQVQKQIGQTGIPAYNVSNACATGATALRTVMLSIKAGEADMGLAVGVEQMGKMGLLGGAGSKKEAKVFAPSGRYGAVTGTDGYIGTAGMPVCSPRRAWGTPTRTMASASSNSPRLRTRTTYIRRSTRWPNTRRSSASTRSWAPVMSYPNTLLMCCPTGDGAAAAVLVSGERLKSMPKKVQKRAVKISASVLTSDPWTSSAQVQPDVNTLTRNAAAQAYEQAGVGPDDLDLVELHDCFATAELIHYDNLGLWSPEGR